MATEAICRAFQLVIFAMAAASSLVAENLSSALDDKSLRVSDGSQFVPQPFFPKFSWDTVPTYYMFGNQNRLLTPKQVSFIAGQTGFLCIEKSHGMKPLGAAELAGQRHFVGWVKRRQP